MPGSVRLDKLHRMLQAAMGWEDRHLHAFRVGDERFGMQFDDFPAGEQDEKTVTVSRALTADRPIVYTYDFGDDWRHKIVVQSVSRFPTGLKFAVCVDGDGACPPEDAGGPPGYADMLAVLDDPTHEEHEHVRAWLGATFDPSAFDVTAANVRLQAVR